MLFFDGCHNTGSTAHTVCTGFVLAGHASATAGCEAASTTFDPLSSVSCKTPSQRPGCFPVLTPGNNPYDYSTFSGWTADGRALHAIGTALALQPGALSIPAPCLLKCGYQPYPPPGPYGGMPLPPPYCVKCGLDSTGKERVSELDFGQLVMSQVVPPSSLRLVPELAGLDYIKTLRSSGIPFQGTVLPSTRMYARP